MSFLNPHFLYGLFALAIPIIIHLFNFRKTKRVYFSNTRFLRTVKESSSAKRKLKHYLILASRLFFIFFLVLAFAQPFIPAEDDQQPGSRVAIYLDNSLSMSNEARVGISALEAGIQYIEALMQVYPDEVSYRLITNEFSSTSNGYKSKNEVSDLLSEVRLSGISRSAGEVYNRLVSKTDEQSTDLYWISDFQRSNFQQDFQLDSLKHLNLAPVIADQFNNISVDSVYLDDPFFIGDNNISVSVVLLNHGTQPINDLVVKILLNDVQTGTASIDIASGEREVVKFDLSQRIANGHKGTIVFEEYPVSFDNEFYFTIPLEQKIKILEIKGEAGKAVSDVYGNTTLFDFNTTSIDNLEYSLIGKQDLVILHGVGGLEQSLLTRLKAYTRDGGDLLIVPPKNFDLTSYRSLTGNITMNDSLHFTTLATPDYKNPFYEKVFEEENAKLDMPKAAPILNLGSNRTAIMRFVNGKTFMSGREGTWIMAAPLTNAYSGFQNHALFVPVMYRLALLSASHESQLYHRLASTQIVFKNSGLEGDAVYKLIKSNHEIIPAQRMVEQDLMMEIPANMLEPGFYSVSHEKDTVGVLAFNYAKAESDLSRLESGALNNYFGEHITLLETDNIDKFSGVLEKKLLGKEFWKLAILLALVFLLAEILLIRFLP